MLTLCIDTAYKYLSCALIKDDEIISSYSKECFKHQSEEVFVVLEELFKKADISKRDIDSICISKGPGSYTGVRIAMTIAKVLSEVMNIDLYTISTLRLYAGDNEKTMVLMDARASRAYIGIYDKNEVIKNDSIIYVKDIDVKDYQVVGDGSLVGKPDRYDDICLNFLKTKKYWQKVDNISHLTPNYLKENEEYFK